jgi:hypothetical protein
VKELQKRKRELLVFHQSPNSMRSRFRPFEEGYLGRRFIEEFSTNV